MLELKNLRILTVSALLVALGIIAGFFKIPISNILEIRLMILPLAPAGALFGPGIAAIVGMLSDLGGYVLASTGPYFPGFTLSYGLNGVIFGLFLRPDQSGKISMTRIILSVVVNAVLVNLLLNSLWLNILYPGQGFTAVLTARIIKELIMIPIYVILIAALLKPIMKYFGGIMDSESIHLDGNPNIKGTDDEGNDL